MSLINWVTEYCLITDLEKWKGLRKENLEKHELTLSVFTLIDREGNTFKIDSNSCKLCNDYFNDLNSYSGSCGNCPLFKELNFKSCDDMNQPYRIFIEEQDPEPMIRYLSILKEKNLLPLRTVGENEIYPKIKTIKTLHSKPE